MKKLILFVYILVICTFSMQNIFAFSGETDKPQTLLQMQEEKQELKKQETVLQFKWTTFQLGNDSLGDIMKISLTEQQKQKLEGIISIYVESKNELEKDLNKSIESGREIESIKQQLLKGKHQFYKDLIPFIQIKKLESFKKYVDSDLNYNEKSKHIQNKIQQKDVEQSERLEELQDKIDDNSRTFRRKIEETITLQVRGKLDIFILKENFRGLSNEIKTEIFTKIIRKFEIAINDLEDVISPTRALEERIIGLEVVVEILDSYVDIWR